MPQQLHPQQWYWKKNLFLKNFPIHSPFLKGSNSKSSSKEPTEKVSKNRALRQICTLSQIDKQISIIFRSGDDYRRMVNNPVCIDTHSFFYTEKEKTLHTTCHFYSNICKWRCRTVVSWVCCWKFTGKNGVNFFSTGKRLGCTTSMTVEQSEYVNNVHFCEELCHDLELVCLVGCGFLCFFNCFGKII